MENKRASKARMKPDGITIAACFLVVMLILPGLVSARERKSGRELSLIMKDGQTLRGELLAVKGERLILMDSSSLAGIEVQIGEVAHLQVIKKSKFLRGLGIGVLSGAAGGAIIGFLSGDDKPESSWIWFPPPLTAGQKALGLGLVLGILGGSIGGIAGAIAGIDESADLTSLRPEQINSILIRLKSFARMADESPANLRWPTALRGSSR